ncbi:MAG TPA: hypothetical protein VM032_04100 [Vicinamibacterales bacterium]|nr:hypothetical protein [Vicinamibacterales bacterium]
MRNACPRWRVVTVLVALTCLARAPRADGQSLSRLSLDSVSAIDLFKGDGTTGNPGASLDISSVIRLGGGWSAHVRPWFFKSSADGSEWSRELYQAALRYERAGRRSVRLDAGYIASPIGLGMLDMRADINPTIQPHLSYFVPLMPFDRAAPRVGAITASYPLGANLTVSSRKWDARAALVNAAPTRRYAFNSKYGNPASTPFGIVGGGISPATGLRLGASFGAGRYATREESADALGVARQLTMWTIEGEYAFGYTKVSAEVTHERFDRVIAHDVSTTWFVQGTHTLTPRWFAAGRHEAIAAPPMAIATAGAPRLRFRTTEGSAGYRAHPEITLRASVAVVRWYTAPVSDVRVGAQLVWSRRWW